VVATGAGAGATTGAGAATTGAGAAPTGAGRGGAAGADAAGAGEETPVTDVAAPPVARLWGEPVPDEPVVPPVGAVGVPGAVVGVASAPRLVNVSSC